MNGLLLMALLMAPVDPTFLRRSIDATVSVPAETCHYQALFGEGDKDGRIARGVARFGVITVTAGGRCVTADHRGEEQVYVVLEGSGTLRYADAETPVRKNDFVYLAAGVARSVASTAAPLRIIVMGYKTTGAAGGGAGKPLIANVNDVPKQVVGNHPPSTLYQLLVGDVNSKRDRISAGRVLTSLFIMNIEPGGTNTPHHHETEEEIYVVLEGNGDMVAGSGMDGVEGRFPAKAGDAYFFRLNCTVGYYAKTASRILAVRSLFPFRK